MSISLFNLIDQVQGLWQKSFDTIKDNAAAQALIADTSFAKYQKTDDAEQNKLVTPDVIIKHDYNNIAKIESLIEQKKDNEALKNSLSTFLQDYQKNQKIHNFIEEHFVGTLESWYRIRKTVEYLYAKTTDIYREQFPLGDLFADSAPTLAQQKALYSLMMVNSHFGDYLDLNDYLNVELPDFVSDVISSRKKVAYFDRDIANYQKIYLRQSKHVVAVFADSDNEAAKAAADSFLGEIERLFNNNDNNNNDNNNNDNNNNDNNNNDNNNNDNNTDIIISTDSASARNNTKSLIELLNNKFQSAKKSESYYSYIDFKMTDNDLTLDAEGNIDFCFDYECMQQNIDQALKTFKGEYDFDINLGIEYKKILGQWPDVVFLTHQIKKQLEGLKNVDYTKIELLTAAKRIVEANVKCQTKFGEINVRAN